MANPLDDIQALLNAMRDRGNEMEAFKNLLASIDQALRDAVACMEEPEAPEPPDPKDEELIALLKRLSIPQATVTVAAPSITVQPATVQVMQAPGGTVRGEFIFGASGRPTGFTLTRS